MNAAQSHREVRSLMCRNMADEKDIWFVENNSALRFLNDNELSKTKYKGQGLSFGSVELALEALECFCPSVVFLDLYMDGDNKDGWDFIRESELMGYRGQIIITSSTMNPEHKERARTLGVSFIEKPITSELIESSIKEND